jgi:DNA-binding IclR family transcriptional regulator
MIAFLPHDELQKMLSMKFQGLTPRTITDPKEVAEDLARVRERGWSVDDEESLPGLRCVGAPIWDDEKVVAGLSASGSTLYVTYERIDEIAQAVMAAADEISTQLGWGPRRPKNGS